MQKQTIHLLSAAVLMTSCFSAWGAGTIYKCMTPQGELSYQKKPCHDNVKTLSSWEPKPESAKKEAEPDKKSAAPIIATPSGQGHYLVDAEIDSHSLTFVVDTGASQVSLPFAFAQSANLFCDNDVPLSTANGIGSGCTTVINELKMGGFVFNKVNALIVPNLDRPLLGMNVLRNFDIEQKDGEMRLSEHVNTESAKEVK